MSVQQVFKCDALNCEVTKGENNHWYMVSDKDPDAEQSFFVAAWDPKLEKVISGMYHCCGQECLHKMLDRWLQSGRLS